MKKVCRKLMPRADKFCRLMEGHKGCCRHDSVWYCDSCGLPRSGVQAAYDSESGNVACWLCVNKFWPMERAKVEAYDHG